MNSFSEGLKHILDLNGYDHILFLTALVAGYNFDRWKRILLLATAFTLGHSVTLGLAATNMVHFSSDWIEFLIPLTIFLTSIFRFAQADEVRVFALRNYLFTAGFGLIHGLGFSSYFRMLYEGSSELLSNLFFFNCGVETGQIVIITIIIGIGTLMNSFFKITKDRLVKCTSVIIALLSIWMMVEKFPFTN